MKKNYQRPNLKVFEIDTTEILAASPAIGGNTGIGTGEGEPPTTGNAKSGIFDSGSAPSNSIWGN